MTSTEYETYIDTFIEDYDLSVTNDLKQQLADLSSFLSTEFALNEDDIHDELLDIVPTDLQKDEDWNLFVSDLASVIADDAETTEDCDTEYDEFDDSD